MTAITPLETIHKKGVFGDHQKKNSNELLKISEVKNLTIVQLVQYKKAKIEIKKIKIDGLELPIENSTSASNEETRILWSAPRTWLIVSTKEKVINNIKENCNIENFAITDISHSRAVIQLNGIQAKEVLKKGCPLNFYEFKKNNCAGTVFHGINIVLDCIDDEKEIFNILTLRSFGESFYHHITDASLEFGYIGV